EDEAVEKLQLLQSDPLLTARIASNGQAFAESQYSFARVGRTLAAEIQREMRPWQPPSLLTRLWVKLRYGMQVPE
ncbi:MAG: glycosyltransferase family 1 protein, partial [Pseudomonas fluorescens]